MQNNDRFIVTSLSPTELTVMPYGAPIQEYNPSLEHGEIIITENRIEFGSLEALNRFCSANSVNEFDIRYF